MLGGFAGKIFGTANERRVRSLRSLVAEINALEPAISALSDEALRTQTGKLRERLAAGETLDDLLPEAFATAREGAHRAIGLRPFDVQLMGGIVLHQGKIAEMRTGEGKTLVAVLAVYLNALPGNGVHVVTVNDYLARRDSEWMGRIYRFLGLTVACIVNDMIDPQRKAAYACDITYATNNELGFDFLRDNMKYDAADLVQRPFNYAIVDEVDSILIDEARTPLIISGPAEDSSNLYKEVDKVIPELTPGVDFEHDEKQRSASLTEEGVEHLEEILRAHGLLDEGGLYDAGNVTLVHHVNQALRAHIVFTRDVSYIIKDDKVVLIDEFTGRMTPGRRYSEGLHQALEAKEGVTIQEENQTLASITFQNYFRMYPKLAGMTGTAMTEASEFGEIYNLDVVEIPTNRPVSRVDDDDEIYRTAAEKNVAIAALIKDIQDRKQPILVGTTSIEKSEQLSEMLNKLKIPHQVLNARHHEQEAHIIAQAGRPRAVTVATNMAGRGTDIKLGGNFEMRLEEEAPEDAAPDAMEALAARIRSEIEAAQGEALGAGGLYVIGTERHESRRIDNQLRGRSGRQGDPGASKFFLSLEDDLMRIFGHTRMDAMLQRFGLKEGEAIVHPWINKALERAQQKVEQQNFDARKDVLRYDDVMNDQRKVVYEQRREIITGQGVSELLRDMRHDVIHEMVRRSIPANAYAEQWNVDALQAEVVSILNLTVPVAEWAAEEGIAEDEILERLLKASDEHYATQREGFGDAMPSLERSLLLQVLDHGWKEHLLAMDHLRQGIRLRSYGQRDPLTEYKREAFELFEGMLNHLREQVTRLLSHVSPAMFQGPPLPPEMPPPSERQELRYDLATDPQPGVTETLTLLSDTQIDPADPTTWGKVPRNNPCPCGSGKKYKHCHGQVADK